jgi:chemotaxis protein methyltransferase CheR
MMAMELLGKRDLSRLRERIAAYSGLDASVLSDDALQHAVARRLAAHALQRPEQYWPLVHLGSGERTDPDPGILGQRDANGEILQLVQTLTNKETFFFREGHHFEALHHEILPALLAPDRPRHPLRVWSAGCATGEEPYSLAITLLEYRARHGFFEAEILATDIDEAALRVAQRGCYGQRSLRLVPDEARRRYFRPQGESGEEQGWCILPEAAALVTFRRYNLADQDPPAGAAGFDLIFCRNVSIYFHPAARDRLNARLAAALRPGGYLFVASAETMGHNQGRLKLVSLGNTFLFRKQAPTTRPAPGLAPGARGPASRMPAAAPLGARQRRDATPVEARRTAAASRPADPVDGSEPRAGSDPMREAVRAFGRQEFEVALAHLERLGDAQRERLDVRCLRAAIFLQRAELQEAERLCQEVLARDPWHADAHFMLGLTHRQRGRLEAAVQALKQAIYLQPGHRDAHFFLAETYRSLGLAAQARHEYENTLNILADAAQGRDEPAFHLTGLADEKLRHACQVNLKNLRPSPRLHPEQRARRW